MLLRTGRDQISLEVSSTGRRLGVKEFVFKRGTENWPQGDTLWHVYALPDLRSDTALQSLILV